MTRPCKLVGRFGELSVDILCWYGQRVEERPPLSALTVRWSERRVVTKLAELADRGYIDFHYRPRGGRLTYKGRAALAEIQAARG